MKLDPRKMLVASNQVLLFGTILLFFLVTIFGIEPLGGIHVALARIATGDLDGARSSLRYAEDGFSTVFCTFVSFVLVIIFKLILDSIFLKRLKNELERKTG